MNRKNDMFSIFENVGDDIAERISNSCQSMSREEKERVLAMSERKLNDMKKTKKIIDEVNVGIKSRPIENNVGKVEIVDNPRSRRLLITATAAAAAFAVIVGVAFAAKNVGDIDVDSDISSVSSDKDLYAQISTTHDNADSENSNTVTSRESSADSEKVSGEENSKKEEKSSREKSSSSEVTSSKSESVVLESTVSNEVQSDINSQSADVNEQKPDTISDESISGAAEGTDTDIKPLENAAGVYSSKYGIITLYADGTGTISFQDTISIKWNDQVLIGENFTYPYTISGDTLTLDMQGVTYVMKRDDSAGSSSGSSSADTETEAPETEAETEQTEETEAVTEPVTETETEPLPAVIAAGSIDGWRKHSGAGRQRVSGKLFPGDGADAGGAGRRRHNLWHRRGRTIKNRGAAYENQGFGRKSYRRLSAE